jgi:hypothetical protein
MAQVANETPKDDNWYDGLGDSHGPLPATMGMKCKNADTKSTFSILK